MSFPPMGFDAYPRQTFTLKSELSARTSHRKFAGLGLKLRGRDISQEHVAGATKTMASAIPCWETTP